LHRLQKKKKKYDRNPIGSGRKAQGSLAVRLADKTGWPVAKEAGTTHLSYFRENRKQSRRQKLSLGGPALTITSLRFSLLCLRRAWLSRPE
jgi:hypothetical protein